MRSLRLPTMLVALTAVLAAESGACAEQFDYVRMGEPSRRLCGGAVPAGWEGRDFDDAALGETGAVDGGRPPDAGRLPDGGVPRCEVLRLRKRFDVGPELSRLATLELQVRYQDGFIAWLNGQEVARRRYAGGGAPFATETHGPEVEHIVLTVPSGLLAPAGNVIALEVHPARPTRTAAGDVALIGADALRITRGPHLVRVLDSEALVVIDTDLPSRAEASWGPADVEEQHFRTVTDPDLDTHHALRLGGLQAGRTYRYRIALREPDGARPLVVEAAFHTPPTPGHSLRFVVTGDVRSGHAVHAQIVRDVVAEDPDLVLMTGDLVDLGSDEAEWQRYFATEAPLLRQVPVYSALGNHDHARGDEGLARFLTLFERRGDRPWSSFDVSGVHFVLLDSDSYRNAEQLAWLRDDLAAARRRRVRAIIACTHHGPWSSALHGDNLIAAREYVPVLEAGGVGLLFAGHDHDYERGRVGKIDYVVSGGGGAELRAPRCGVPGRRRCPPRMKAFANEHHYIVVEVLRDRVRLCPKRPDGTLLEDCPVLPLRR